MKFFLILCLPFILYAHSLKVFATKNNDSLYVKSYFNTSSPCIECSVEVKTRDNKTLKFKTDKKGEINIDLSHMPVSILVNGGLGHQKKIDLDIHYADTDKSIAKTSPFWLKILFSFIGLILFFAGLRWVKKT